VGSSLSRRSFLAGLGGGLASAALAWGVWKYNLPGGLRDAAPVPECCHYVDYAGWMLTRSDKERLLAQDSLKLLDASRIDGHNFADQVVGDASACAAWCLAEPDCQGFTYAKPNHPDPNTQNRCWLKDTSQLTPTPDSLYTSGVR
jgi:hypothetical protein